MRARAPHPAADADSTGSGHRSHPRPVHAARQGLGGADEQVRQPHGGLFRLHHGAIRSQLSRRRCRQPRPAQHRRPALHTALRRWEVGLKPQEHVVLRLPGLSQASRTCDPTAISSVSSLKNIRSVSGLKNMWSYGYQVCLKPQEHVVLRLSGL